MIKNFSLSFVFGSFFRLSASHLMLLGFTWLQNIHQFVQMVKVGNLKLRFRMFQLEVYITLIPMHLNLGIVYIIIFSFFHQ